MSLINPRSPKRKKKALVFSEGAIRTRSTRSNTTITDDFSDIGWTRKRTPRPRGRPKKKALQAPTRIELSDDTASDVEDAVVSREQDSKRRSISRKLTHVCQVESAHSHSRKRSTPSQETIEHDHTARSGKSRSKRSKDTHMDNHIKEEPSSDEEDDPSQYLLSLLRRSAKLRYKFPTSRNRLSRIAGVKNCKNKTIKHMSKAALEVVEHARSTRPILHDQVVNLLGSFLELKRTKGWSTERSLYRDMNVCDLVDRLLSKRPLVFFTENDRYMLTTGETGTGGFRRVGTDKERHPLLLKDVLSYDEMSLSALLGVSVPTHFINDGRRNNKGAAARKNESYEPKGVYVGLVGARFEKPGMMEWKHMIIDKRQNTTANGYGRDTLDDEDSHGAHARQVLRLWAEFYREGDPEEGEFYFPSYREAKAGSRSHFMKISSGSVNYFLNLHVYRIRIRLSVEPFLFEANDRAAKQGKKAYVHAVGLGLGVWMLSEAQVDVMVDVYATILRKHRFEHISDVDFSWFDNADKCGGVRDGGTFREGGNSIKIHFSQRSTSDRVAEDKLLVAMYAWDSNSFPGNEYWIGNLSASGDPAAACCSTIPELQNPSVNFSVRGETAVVWGGPQKSLEPCLLPYRLALPDD